ncbi:hypothetical protein [Salinigranum sp.]
MKRFPPSDESGHSALVASEDGDTEWVGPRTYCAEAVRRLEAVVADDFC